MSKEKKILNNKFREIYKKLVEERVIIPEQPNGDNSLLAFAKKIGVDVSDIGNYLAGNIYISYDTAVRICEEYNINKAYLFDDITNVLDLSTRKAGNVIYVEDIEFFCGSGILTQTRNFERYDDYSLNGEFWAFKASGDSMEKTIYSGDMVYATKLLNPDYINKNEICAIATLDEALLKRVKTKKYDKKTGKLIQLILISDNTQCYPEEREVDVLEITRIFKVEEIRTKNTLKKK